MAELCPKGNFMPLSLQELKVAASFLRQARALCEGVRDFFRAEDADLAARVGEISNRLDNEADYVARLILARPGGDLS
jgi:hypothetical protein